MSVDWPSPRFIGDDAPFWEYARRRELRLQRCTACGAWRFPAAPLCDRCLGPDAEWAPVSGRGTVYSWVIFHRQYFPALPPPYNVASIELAEGPLFIANLIDIPDDAIRIGLPVEIAWREVGPDYVLPVFRPAPTS